MYRMHWVVLVVALAGVGCSEPTPRNIDELVARGDLFLDPETLDPYTGPAFSLHDGDTKKLEVRVTLQNGKFDGPYVSFHENGQLSFAATYKSGAWDGPFDTYYENGQLRSRMTYKDGVEDGPTQMYTEGGELAREGTMKNGVRCGEWLIDGLPVTHPLPCT